MLGQKTKESLNEIQPGGVRRGEIKMKTRVPSEPSFDRRRFVSREVVENDMHLKLVLNPPVDLSKKVDEVD